MARLRSTETAALWRQRLRRFERSGLTVTNFCEQEGCSVPSFYAWRKKLAKTGTGKGRHERQPAGPFRPITLSAAVPVSIQLAGGTRIEVAAADVKLVRAVVHEVARAARAEKGGPAC